MRGIVFTIIFLGCSIGLYSQDSPPFEIELIVPVASPEGKRVISHKPYPRFHVLLKNISSQTQRMWKDWNSWGYYNLTFEVVTPWDTTLVRRISPGKWEGDFSDFWVIPPGETVILEVHSHAQLWKGFPIPLGRKVPAQLTAILRTSLTCWLKSSMSGPEAFVPRPSLWFFNK